MSSVSWAGGDEEALDTRRSAEALNIEALGLTMHGYPPRRVLEVVCVDEAIAVIEANRGTVVGLKVIASSAGPEASDGP